MHSSGQHYDNRNQKEDLELPLFDLATIANSTKNFSINNKLGEGGFGPVYKVIFTKLLTEFVGMFLVLILGTTKISVKTIPYFFRSRKHEYE